MSTAQAVPETWELTGDDAAAVLREARVRRLLVDSIKRLRAADGFSQARSLALALVLTVIPGVVVIVAAARGVGADSFHSAVADLSNAISPGDSGDVVTAAIRQGADASGGTGGLLVGGVAMLISGMTFFGQIERSANRIYGIEQDRPFVDKYSRALLFLTASVVLIFATFLVLGTVRHVDFPGPDWMWFVIRGGILLAAAALSFAYIFKAAPNRRQPQESWLIVGSAISTVAWAASTLTLAWMWRIGNSFGRTYGRLAGVMAFIIWAYLISLGLHIGLAFAAQLEAVRSGRSQPQDPDKAEDVPPARPSR